jgi:hypothetical protein
MNEQAATVTITVPERFALLQIMLGMEIKEKLERRRFNRAYEALKLTELESCLQNGLDQATIEASDNKLFLTIENVEFVLDAINKVPLKGAGVRILGPVEERFENLLKK